MQGCLLVGLMCGSAAIPPYRTFLFAQKICWRYWRCSLHCINVLLSCAGACTAREDVCQLDCTVHVAAAASCKHGNLPAAGLRLAEVGKTIDFWPRHLSSVCSACNDWLGNDNKLTAHLQAHLHSVFPASLGWPCSNCEVKADFAWCRPPAQSYNQRCQPISAVPPLQA